MLTVVPNINFPRRHRVGSSLAWWCVVSTGVWLATGLPADVAAASRTLTEEFTSPVAAKSGASFGTEGWLTFELYRGGTFVIDGASDVAVQQSPSYRDVALIRSTKALPKTYTVRATVGKIDYELEAVEGLAPDPNYDEGPRNENGCYLLAITDTLPSGHHTNDWWHQHRKVVIDIDNNVWGSGMPHPIFMVSFDTANALVAWNGAKEAWQHKWRKAVEYAWSAWYTVAIQRTPTHFILSVADEPGRVLQQAEVPLEEAWHADAAHPDYVVIGDPHENYYQGSMQIQSLGLTLE